MPPRRSVAPSGSGLAIGWASALWGAALYWLAGVLYLIQAGEIIKTVPRVHPVAGRAA